MEQFALYEIKLSIRNGSFFGELSSCKADNRPHVAYTISAVNFQQRFRFPPNVHDEPKSVVLLLSTKLSDRTTIFRLE